MHEKSTREVLSLWRIAFVGLAAILVAIIVVSGVFSRRDAGARAARKAATAARATEVGKAVGGLQTSSYCDGDCPARNPWGDPYVVVLNGSGEARPGESILTNSAA